LEHIKLHLYCMPMALKKERISRPGKDRIS
jgi:hypothetical protein